MQNGTVALPHMEVLCYNFLNLQYKGLYGNTMVLLEKSVLYFVCKIYLTCCCVVFFVVCQLLKLILCDFNAMLC